MDIHHVALAATRKFDGHHARHLSVAEMAQIAGRAGRHTTDGTFGVTGRVRGWMRRRLRRSSITVLSRFLPFAGGTVWSILPARRPCWPRWSGAGNRVPIKGRPADDVLSLLKFSDLPGRYYDPGDRYSGGSVALGRLPGSRISAKP